MGPSLDPLRYGLRALEEMAREQASVAPPAPTRAEVFSPHPMLRPPARDGAAFSLRLFTDAEDDATALVLGDASSRTFAPIPPRAAALFEAHAAVLAMEGEDVLTLGFPLVTFVQQGSTRAAPLFSRGNARAKWRIGEAAWKLPANAREGGSVPAPDRLDLERGDDEPYALHAGVWHYLFGLDGAALAEVAAAAGAGIAALVRAATRVLDGGGDGEERDAESPDAASSEPDASAIAPLGPGDLVALGEAAMRRASPSRGLRVHPHGLAMLPPRGDPTSGLRKDLEALQGEPIAPCSPLAVYLGKGGAAARGDVFTSGSVPPTPSQLEAARAFEGAADIVAVCGPPGCGKTALLHHVTAQAVVACALGNVWSIPPSRGAPWSLVVTSTNNAAVDHALAPFVRGPGLPIGLRLGSRRTLADTTAEALTSALHALETRGDVSLAEARRAFEARAMAVRAFMRERAASSTKRKDAAAQRRSREDRARELRDALARGAAAQVPRGLDLEALTEAETALREHARAAGRLAPLHLDGPRASAPRARDKWDRANALRAPRITPVLSLLGLAPPFGALDATSAREDIASQKSAIEATLASLGVFGAALRAPEHARELKAITEKLAREGIAETPAPPLDHGLYEAALVVREAWARTHRDILAARLAEARGAICGERGAGRARPLPIVLCDLAALFPLAGCTLLSMRASFPLDRDVIDRLVIDEAAQCAPIHAVPALARARRAMLTGDTAQLPPIYTLDPRVDERLARGLDEAAIAPFRMSAVSVTSAQAVAESRARTRLSLTEHFRSQPPIVDLASRWSGYTLDVRTPPRSLADLSPYLAAPVVVLAVRGASERAGEGIVNEAEAERAIRLVTEIVQGGVAPSDIAVLTPFVGQSARIERSLAELGLAGREGVLVSTVHRLQGGERRVVVFSLTATTRRHIKWVAERPHLLHVATSRAQDHLVVLLDPDAARREATLAPLVEALG